MSVLNALLNNKPIRKVAVAGLTAAALYVASRLGVHLGKDEAERAIDAALPILAAYLTRDPRVR